MLDVIKNFWKKGEIRAKTPEERQAYARICGAIGIGMNALLFLVKFICGRVSGSVSIQADAYNNLTDVAVAVISLAGLWLAGMGAGRNHPFGHGRFEWIVGIFSSSAVIAFGGKLVADSVAAIRHPSSLSMNGWIVVTLVCSIIVKGIMYLYNHKIGEKIQSVSMKATAADSISDMMSTAMILVSTLTEAFTGWKFDGFGGLIVSMFILYSGIQSLADGIKKVLGENADPAMIDEILAMVKEYEEISGVSEFYFHDYGMGHSAISMHIEGKNCENREELTMAAQELMFEIYKKYGCEAAIQVDIIDDSRETADKIEQLTKEIIERTKINARLEHLKVIPMEQHTLLNMEIGFDHMEQRHEKELLEQITDAIKSKNPNYEVIIRCLMEKSENSFTFLKIIKSLFPMFEKVC